MKKHAILNATTVVFADYHRLLVFFSINVQFRLYPKRDCNAKGLIQLEFYEKKIT